MKIVLDTRWIFPQISGIGLYTRELVRQFAQIDRENAYTLLFDRPAVLEREAQETGFGAAPNFSARLVPYGIFAPAGQLRLPGLLAAAAADVFHSPNYMIPFLAFPRGRRGRTACVVTIHDLIPLLFPHYTPRALKTRLLPLFRAIMRETGRRADAILTPSASSRADVIRELHVPESRHARVVVTPEAADPRYRPAEQSATGRTVLFVGRRDPYKNLPALVAAFAQVRRRVPEARLRVIGPADARYPEAEQAALAAGLGDAVEWQGYVNGEDLLRAYQQAAVFALPSRYEGFGLPVLEAMACGAPVVCGNRSSLPEVAGAAALLVDPDDEAGIADALVRVLSEPALAADLRRRGLARAAQFSWEQTARLTLAAYRAARG